MSERLAEWPDVCDQNEPRHQGLHTKGIRLSSAVHTLTPLLSIRIQTYRRAFQAFPVFELDLGCLIDAGAQTRQQLVGLFFFIKRLAKNLLGVIQA